MSNEVSKYNVQLIIDLIQKQDKKQEIQIKNLHENLEEKFNCLNSGVNEIKKSNEIILKETAPWRWVSRNPKLSAIIVGVFFLGVFTLVMAFYKGQIESLVKTLVGKT
jgi:polyferredoxin